MQWNAFSFVSYVCLRYFISFRPNIVLASVRLSWYSII
ncbi:hypothetical protein H802_YJM1356G00461 [Saccharomyces cerevisiae YJM1356]|nr:hypothetical protein H786_YJM1242G00425 [Saccharomyces cerevisiae YJM1242]AJS00499.1 hypothetical protein H818_YJM1433G00464 [Saccharomyces cerevisiae YJM1433]AJS04899.1 hypothetical protein H827_YJM1477G00460 [Saccharomyces cerevisiae YJM1477]AJS24503.1 hypothetical protein H802_YJM1356G00461 [Saccharomyces cerevisiae YJM1356]AJS26987.1 hypothetical protein H807_YJM1387G00457 [Saccharomyces cerevisiae YJM1387]